MATTPDQVDAHPVVLVQRWRRGIDVCAVLVDGTVRWIIRDLLGAVGDDAGDFRDEPGHRPLVLAEHVRATATTLEQAIEILGPVYDDAPALLAWMRERETALAAFGYGNAVLAGTQMPEPQLFTVTEAAELLSLDPAIETGMRRLFDHLLTAGWIVRRGTEYAPAQSVVDAGYLAVRPRRIPHTGNPWPQIVLTDAGLAAMHAALGGTDSTVLNQETPR